MQTLYFILTQICKTTFSFPFQHRGEIVKLVFSLCEGLCEDCLTEKDCDLLFAGWLATSLLYKEPSVLKPHPAVHTM